MSKLGAYSQNTTTLNPQLHDDADVYDEAINLLRAFDPQGQVDLA